MVSSLTGAPRELKGRKPKKLPGLSVEALPAGKLFGRRQDVLVDVECGAHHQALHQMRRC
jgi:hypothetical protein